MLSSSCDAGSGPVEWDLVPVVADTGLDSPSKASLENVAQIRWLYAKPRTAIRHTSSIP